MPPRTGKRTSSMCTPETERGTHVFTIADYSQYKGLGPGKFISSATFAVGDYDWCIRYYPEGDSDGNGDRRVSVAYVELLSPGAKVRAFYSLRLVNQDTGLSAPVFTHNSNTPDVFHTMDIGEYLLSGTGNFMKGGRLEVLAYLRDDRVVIECDITVMKDPRVTETVMDAEVELPPPDLSKDIRKLLETKMGADVTFSVGGEIFTAHSVVLAARSPVFEAQLYGPMSAERDQQITIQDMQPAVFRALLHFIYTDLLIPAGNLDGDEKNELIKHLVRAADRYAIERLKFICENKPSKILNVENVATIFALADYEHLKISCPAVLVDIFERATKSRKI